MGKLLLFFSLLAFATSAFSHAAINAETPTPRDGSVSASSPWAGMSQGLDVQPKSNISEQTRTCLRIHAFIFKTEDDRVPQLVRETTCIPADRPVLKKANENAQPKLVPADGGNRF
jgi:hypothetical protein